MILSKTTSCVFLEEEKSFKRNFLKKSINMYKNLQFITSTQIDSYMCALHAYIALSSQNCNKKSFDWHSILFYEKNSQRVKLLRHTLLKFNYSLHD